MGWKARFGCSFWLLCLDTRLGLHWLLGLGWLYSDRKQPHSLFSPNKIALALKWFLITEDWHFFGYEVLWRLAFICLFHLERYTPQPPWEGQLRKNIAIGLGHIGRYGFDYFLYFLDAAELTLWRGRLAYFFFSFQSVHYSSIRND